MSTQGLDFEKAREIARTDVSARSMEFAFSHHSEREDEEERVYRAALNAQALAMRDEAVKQAEREARAEQEVLASAVRQCAEDTKGYLASIERETALIAVLRTVCPSDEMTGVQEEFLYVCQDEDGEPIVEANTPAEAVEQILACWESVAERLDAAEGKLAALAPLLQCWREWVEARKEKADPDVVADRRRWVSAYSRLLAAEAALAAIRIEGDV